MSVQSPSIGERIAGFFAWCGGAKVELIREFPEERTRLATIGATVLFTGLFAGVSSSYAFYTVFGKGWWVPVLAALWGAAIFNIDRLIVMTMHGSFARKLLAAIPRLVLATVIAVVITRPLELWIFAPEIEREVKIAEGEAREVIDKELEAAVTAAENAYKAAVATAGAAAGVDTSKKALDDALAGHERCKGGLQKLQNEYVAELNGRGGSGRVGDGPIARRVRGLVEAADGECRKLVEVTETARRTFDAALLRQSDAAKDHLATRDKAIAAAVARRDEKEAALDSTRIDSLLGRNQQLSNLVATSSSVFWMNFFLMLLFWLVEAMPVLAKLMAGDNIYDAVVAERREAVRATRRGATEAADAHAAAGRAEAVAAAKSRQQAIELHYKGVTDVLEASRAAFRMPQAIVDDLLASIERTARQTLLGAQPQQSELDGAPSSLSRLRAKRASRSLLELGLNLFIIVVVMFVVYAAAAALFSPISKADLSLAITAGALVAGWLALKPVSQLFARISGGVAGEGE